MQAQTVQQAIQAFSQDNLKTAALDFFNALGYSSNKTSSLDITSFLPNLNHDKAFVNQWQSSYLLFQLADEDLQNNLDVFHSSNQAIDNTIIQSYLFAAIELNRSTNLGLYSRTELVKITRAINKASLQPVLLLFKHGDSFTLSVIHRRINKIDNDKDVLEKFTLIKDIRLENTHRAHFDILNEFSFENLKPQPTNFVELHNAWQKVLNTKTLNKQFYEKLFDWYLFALPQVKFPQIRAEADLIIDEQHQSESLIRLLTRLLFVWFMKEKGLINVELFEPTVLKTLLKNFTGENSNDTIYYKAILQNLFFATLNMPIEKRKVIYDGFNPKDYGNQLVYRYADLFVAENFVEHFENIPFLNGGLFDCLDQRKTDSSPEIRLDGFSTQAKKQAVAPDKLFFGEYKNVDLSSAYDNKKKSNVTVYGLIDILQNHKFTVEENTPLEEDIALDPELLGQVFENLLAAYNPETGTTARKQTGSFYTPREIVDYMVDESLIAYFRSPIALAIGEETKIAEAILLPKLCNLLSYDNTKNPFDETQTTLLIKAIDNLKILDPACGSGAFPMGILHKLVFVLSKLDPKNEQWRDRQIAKLKAIDDSACREKATQVINDAFENNELDYGRKLFLIENCIHGVDIQPIATQISKLRFFISLIVDQKSHGDKANNFGIRPLPNLDFKIIAANTLIAAPQDDFENNALFSNDAFFENFSDLTHDYFKVANPDEKRKLRDKIENIINDKCAEKIKAIESLSHNKIKNKKIIDHAENDMKLWQSYARLFKHEAVAFFEPRYFFPQLIEGFDIVIGNPPYIQIQKFSGQAIQNDWKNQHYATFQKTGDIYALFIEKGVSLLNQNGLLAFITSNKWMRAGYGKSLRNFLATKTQPLKLIDFGGYQVFDSATVDSNILITKNIGAQKTAKAVLLPEVNNGSAIASAIVKETKTFLACTIQNDFTIQTPLADYFAAHSQIMPTMSEDVWVISSGIEQQIKAKIEAKGIALKEWDVNIYRGVLTGFDEAFIINTETKERLCLEDTKSAEIIKPILRGRDIKRYSAELAGLWLINSHNNPPVKIDDYPAIKKHLDAYYPRLEKRLDKGATPYNLRNCAYLKAFEREKIVYPNMTKYRPFFFDTDSYFVNPKCFMITSDTVNLKSLIAILNSWVFDFAFKNKFPSLGEDRRELLKVFFEQLPIPKIPESQQQPFITLVDKILADKKAGNDTRALEREIDVLVYELYGLSEEEINIINGVK